ncbi:hypothetical protein [Comamonas sp. lk]|uniref:hypothetical protein n=1 Tax=Comamonas sp. lk TaxID=2201272 RepID=UPI0013CE8873|nr:hypothetical protein [Comamonas sp. lk]
MILVENNNKSFVILYVAIGFVIGGILSIPIATWFYFSPAPTFEINGQIGDFFGGILNPIVALMALVWLVKGVKLQQKELEETKFALQASEKHQAAQVRISAITALISSLNDEQHKLRDYRKTVQIAVDDIVKQHDEQARQLPPGSTLCMDVWEVSRMEELQALNSAIEKYEEQKTAYLAELRTILEG